MVKKIEEFLPFLLLIGFVTIRLENQLCRTWWGEEDEKGNEFMRNDVIR